MRCVNLPICPTNSMRIPWCSSLLPVCFTLIFTLTEDNTRQFSLTWRNYSQSHRWCLLTHLSWNWFSIIKQIMLLQLPILSLQLCCFSAFSIVQNDINFTHRTKKTSKETLKEWQSHSIFSIHHYPVSDGNPSKTNYRKNIVGWGLNL